MPPIDDQGREAAHRAAEHAQEAAVAAGLAAGAAADALGSVAGSVAAGVSSAVAAAVREGAERLPAAPEVLEGVLEDAFGRGVDAWDALRGRSRPARRWPWATGGAVAGAAVAVAGALVLRRLSTRDAPGAQEPEQVRAVVDTSVPAPDAAVPPGAAVDEDGEVHQPG